MKTSVSRRAAVLPSPLRTLIVFSAFAAALALPGAPALRAGEIHEAAAAGDLEKVRALIEADPALLESKDVGPAHGGNTPLISACWGPPSNRPQAAVANFLIDSGANIHARNDSGGTPLYFATRDFGLAERLIAKGASVNLRAYGDYTPLHQAGLAGNLKVAKLLLDHGADPDARGAEGSVLHQLIYFERPSHQEMAELFLDSGAKLQEFSFGNTELHMAALNGLADMAQLLLDHGAKVDAVNDYGHTPLYYAARHGHRGVADVLVARGANRSDIAEANYGRAAQLTATLERGEAYLWYLGGTGSPYTGYAVKTKEHLLIFNPSEIDASPEAGLANGRLNPTELAGQRITALISYQSYQGRFGRPTVSELAQGMPGINLVLPFRPAADAAGNGGVPPYRLATPHESFAVDGIQVHTIPALNRVFFGGEGLGYLVEVDGVKVFHAGLHASNGEASQGEEFRKEIDFLKPFAPIDIAILPISGRHLRVAYEPYLYLIDQLSPSAVYLIGDDLATEEDRKCLDVLKARSVAVEYPEGGIARGERFHYRRD